MTTERVTFGAKAQFSLTIQTAGCFFKKNHYSANYRNEEIEHTVGHFNNCIIQFTALPHKTQFGKSCA